MGLQKENISKWVSPTYNGSVRSYKSEDTSHNRPHRYAKTVSNKVKTSLESLRLCQGCKTWQHPIGNAGEEYCEKCGKKFGGGLI